MLVRCNDARVNTEVSEKLAADTRILGNDHIDGFKNIERPQGNIAQISDRRCHHI